MFEQNDFEEIFLAVCDCWGGVGVRADRPHLPARHQVHLQKRYVCVSTTTLEDCVITSSFTPVERPEMLQND